MSELNVADVGELLRTMVISDRADAAFLANDLFVAFKALVTERDRLRAQVTELQTRMTEMVEAQPHRRVAAFQADVVQQPFPGGPPRVPSDEAVRDRLRLVAEGFFEFLFACLDVDEPDYDRIIMRMDLNDAQNVVMRGIGALQLRVNLPQAIDAIARGIYLLEGTALAFGVHMPPIHAEVHRSNMAMSDGPVVDGKLRKPEGWTPPDIAGELRKQGWSGK